MFWNEYTGGSAVLGGHLDRENFTLADLLEHDDILQECRSQNKKLVDFLVDRSTIKELIGLIITEPTEADDPANCYRHPALACEIITSGVPGLIEKMTTDDELLSQLFSFLDNSAPLNPLLASFFSKTFQVLLSRQYGQDWYSYQLTCLRVLEFSKNCPSFLSKLLGHLGTSAVMDTIQSIMHVEIEEMKKDFLIWLDTQKFIEKLVCMVAGTPDLQNDTKATEPALSSTADNVENNSIEQEVTAPVPVTDKLADKRMLADRSENASKLLCNLILKERDTGDDCTTNKSDPLIKTCNLPSTVDLLLSSMFSSPIEIRENAIINGIQILLALLNDVPGAMKPPSSDQEDIQRTAEAVLPYFPQFKEIIAQAPPPFKFGYSNSIERPVGAVRLAAIHLLEVLLHMDSFAIAMSLSKHQIMPLLLEMFVEYKWNNFLHAYVVTMIRKMFEASEYKDIYSNHLFVDCKLLEMIISAWEENDKAQLLQKPRCGYMGHLIQIANYVQDYLVTYPDLLKSVPEKVSDEWKSLISVHLDPINQVQNTYLGGKHPTQPNADQLRQQGYDNLKIQINEINYDDDDAENWDKQIDTSDIYVYMCNKGLISNFRDGYLDQTMSDTFDFLKMFPETSDAQANNMSKNLDENTLYGLASKLSNCETLADNFDQWVATKNWDGAEDDIASGSMPTTITFNNSNPWETDDALANAQTEWADFAAFENANSMSNFATFESNEAVSHSTNPFLCSDEINVNNSHTITKGDEPSGSTSDVSLKTNHCSENNPINENVVGDEPSPKQEVCEQKSTIDVPTSLEASNTSNDEDALCNLVENICLNSKANEPTQPEQSETVLDNKNTTEDPITAEEAVTPKKVSSDNKNTTANEV